MRREIKFRAKAPQVTKCQWIYGYSLRQYDSKNIEIDGVYCNPDTLGQYIGRDKNYNEIYEGDIVEYYTPYKELARDTVEYKYANFLPIVFFNILDFDLKNPAYDCEVIGNIYDNPDLLINK